MVETAKLAVDGGVPVRTEPMPRERGVAYIGAEERRAVLDVLDARSLFRYYGHDLQRKVEQFERRFAAFLGVRHAVGVSSGTAALRTALAALDVGPGDEVIVPAVTFIASVNAVVVQGAVPVFAEVDESFTLDPRSVAEHVGTRTKAIMPVHLMGAACAMDRIADMARGRGIRVVEDCAQACGAEYRGRAVGAWGDAGAFSFQLDKNITSGEGGMVVTDDATVFQRASQYQDQGGQFTLGSGGAREHEGEPLIGENLRMNEISGAILGVQFGRLEAMRAAARRARDLVLEGIASLPSVTLRPVPDRVGEFPTAVGFYVEDAELATRVAKAIAAEGVPARKVYGGKPVYATPSILEQRTISSTGRPFTDPLYLERGPRMDYRMGMCPRSEVYLGRCVVVGISPLMTDKDADDTVAAITKVVKALA